MITNWKFLQYSVQDTWESISKPKGLTTMSFLKSPSCKQPALFFLSFRDYDCFCVMSDVVRLRGRIYEERGYFMLVELEIFRL